MNKNLFRSQLAVFQFCLDLTMDTADNLPLGCLLVGHLVDTHVASLVYFEHPEVMFCPSPDIITQTFLQAFPEIVRIRIGKVWAGREIHDDHVEVLIEDLANLFRGSIHLSQVNAPEETWVDENASAITMLAETKQKKEVRYWPKPSPAGPVTVVSWDSRGVRRASPIEESVSG